MAEASARTFNPIVEFVYSSTKRAYETKLKDGTAGPDISLADMYTIDQISMLDANVNNILSEETEKRNQLNAAIVGKNEIISDIDNNLEAVSNLVDELKAKYVR